MRPYTIAALWILSSLLTIAGPLALAGQSKPSATGISEHTPAPLRYVVRGSQIFDVKKRSPSFSGEWGIPPICPTKLL